MPTESALDGGRTPSYNHRDVPRPMRLRPAFCGASTNEGKNYGYDPSRDGWFGINERVDEDLVAIAKSGDNLAMEYLLNKYKNFVRIKAKSYFLIGADREDIIQEGMIGLYKAVRDFKADKLSSFRAFAELASRGKSSRRLKPRLDRNTSRSINTFRSINRSTMRIANARSST